MAKMRVFELARELNMPGKDLIMRIKAMGFKIGSNFSILDDQQVSVIRAKLSKLSALRSSIIPTVTWTNVSAMEVLDGLQSLGEHHREGVGYDPIGAGVDTFVTWAKEELAQAEQPNSKNVAQHATQAVGHAKRALDCLFDEYIRRFWLAHRLSKRPKFSEKMEILKLVPGLSLPSRLIPRIISGPRDTVEHEHRPPTFLDAAVAVESAEAVITALVGSINPLWGDAFYGWLAGGTVSSERGYHQYFTGFAGPFGLTWRCSDGVIRVGAGRSAIETQAEIIWADIEEFTRDEHVALLKWWHGLGLSSQGGMSEDHLRKKFRLAHLDGPTQDTKD